MLVSTFETAEISALAGTGTGDEESHLRILSEG
jgi:hypothetical protein